MSNPGPSVDRLEELIARQDINDLILRYAHALDTRDWDLMRTCFVPEGSVDYGEYGGLQEGVDAIVDYAASALAGLDATQHLTGNVRVTLSGGTAAATSYVAAQHTRHGTPDGDNFTIGGTYRDELRHTDAGWLIVSRVLDGSWVSGNPAVFDQPAAA